MALDYSLPVAAGRFNFHVDGVYMSSMYYTPWNDLPPSNMSVTPSQWEANARISYRPTDGNFEIGVWGSTDFAGTYKEVDPYVSLTSGKFKFLFTDYNWNFDRANYFNYQNDETGHRLEGTIGYLGSEVLPINITWNTMFYGYDKNTDNEQAYSTYIELGYSKGPASFFFGFTPWASYYNNYGITAFYPGAEKKSSPLELAI